MYLYHFGLKELPFSLTPNTNFYFGLPSHDEAMQVLQTAIKTGEGFIKVTGEVGTGKTLLCRKLLNEIPDAFKVAYLPNPALSPDEIRYALASELGIRAITNLNQQQLSQKIQMKLLEYNSKGQSVILIIDEAQTIPWESFETLRLFTNLETESRKLLQVVLFGQPELDQMLKSSRLRQLRQRITFSYRLRKLTLEEMSAYIRHRLRVSGYSGPEIIADKAYKKLFKYSDGTPRLVNVLCHKVLMLAYGEGTREITSKHVDVAAKDTDAIETNMDATMQWGLIMLSFAGLVVSTWWFVWPVVKELLK